MKAIYLALTASAALASGLLWTNVAQAQNRRGYFGEYNPTYYYGRSSAPYYRATQPAPYAARPYPYYAQYQYGTPVLSVPYTGVVAPIGAYQSYPSLVAPRVRLAPSSRMYFKY